MFLFAADIENVAITQRCTEIQNELNQLKKENASLIRRAKYTLCLFSNPVPVLYECVKYECTSTVLVT